MKLKGKVAGFNYVLRKVVPVLEDNDIPYYLDCGTLLGCIRDNSFMEHDTDVDVATHASFWDKLKKIDFKKYGLIKTRTEDIKTAGGFLMSVKPEDSKYYCDIYANPAMPLLTEKKFSGRLYPIPVEPELYLTQLYGDWKVPKWADGDKYHADWPPLFYKEERLITSDYSKNWDSNYEIKLWENDKMYINNLRKAKENDEYWNNYYKTHYAYLDEPSSFAIFVWLKYLKNKKLKIADLGCGNCRDSKFFSKKGHMCYAVDCNGTLDKEYPKCKLIKKDVEEMLVNNRVHFDIMYMRWFLHAMSYDKSKKIFKNSVNNLKPDGLICVEVRSLNDLELIKDSVYDNEDKSYATTHKRWLYDVGMLETLAKDNGCEILSCDEGYFSSNKNAETRNPLLIRVILKKL